MGFDRLTTTLKGLGFVPSRCDPSLFSLVTPTYTILMLVYVDDIIITGSSPTRIQNLITKLNSQFALKQLGNLDYFLGVEVSHQRNGALFLSQTKYAKDLLSKAKSDAKGLPTPMASNLKLSKHGADYFQDAT